MDQNQELEQFFKEYNIQIFKKNTPKYHPKLESIKPNVKTLYAIGNCALLDDTILAIIGPRKPSFLGLELTKQCLDNIPAHITTISGGAQGIDTYCHEYSMEQGRKTIVVLGEGLMPFLFGRKQFYEKLINNNCLILSERDIHQPAEKFTFPSRNRIIAGLSDKLFLPQAGKKSGSLITANFGLRFNKKVFYPSLSLIDPHFEGIDELREAGKGIALRNRNELGKKEEKSPLKISPSAQKLFEIIFDHKSIHIEKLCILKNSSLVEIMTIISELEIHGLVKQDIFGNITSDRTFSI